MATRFSIIVPTFNSSPYINRCLESLVKQTFSPARFEILVIDNASTDTTVDLVRSHKTTPPHIQLIRLDRNTGPGIARNAGIEKASGEWILFVDSDDELTADALSSLDAYIQTQSDSHLSAIGFDWTAGQPHSDSTYIQRIGRRDQTYFGDREKLIHPYLTHRMDGSVIYTALKRDFLNSTRIRFEHGLHEDVDFIFKVYFYSPLTAYFDKVIYKKYDQPNSIINTVTPSHIEGYFRAWTTIRQTIDKEVTDPTRHRDYIDSYDYGSIGAIATRVREVIRHDRDKTSMITLFKLIYERAKSLTNPSLLHHLQSHQTVYCKITRLFMDVMSSADNDSQKLEAILHGIGALSGKSWSCIDLHYSAFLRPDQVRTCCKRFFIDGQMKGDVVLFDLQKEGPSSISPKQILDAKRDLHQKINSGIPCACDGCPYMEFKAWEPLNQLDIRYLSLEHHSVCNLKCTYCSEDYYGGQKPSFNLSQTIDHFIKEGVLDHCSLIVWGGGEPVLGHDFESVVPELMKKLPLTQQRVLSNSVIVSQAIKSLLAQKKGQLVTSIDAGTEETFKSVRGHALLQTVCNNMQTYGSIDARRTTIKYIFTDQNATLDEVRGFVGLMREYQLARCNFQISSDFKQEIIPRETFDAVLLMYGLLRDAGAQAIYLDDLLWHRLTQENLLAQRDRLHAMAGRTFIASPAQYPHVVIWGAGQQAKFLVEKSSFFKSATLDYFVDATPEKQGTVYCGKNVKDPSVLRTCELPVIIAAVQGYPLILEQYTRLGLPESRLVRELIL